MKICTICGEDSSGYSSDEKFINGHLCIPPDPSCGAVCKRCKSTVTTNRTRICDSCNEELKSLESIPWSELADVPLDGWFRTEGTEFSRITSVNSCDTKTGEITLRFDHGNETLADLFEVAEWSLDPLNGPWMSCSKRYARETVQ
jgi:hypothetical protein